MNRKTKPDSAQIIFQLRVTLKEIEPPIWRTILVSDGITLHKFHKILQIVMGWESYHLYQFSIADSQYGIPNPDYAPEFRDTRKIKLKQVISKKMRFVYVYDFGDNWEHEILVEQILRAKLSNFDALCLGGKRSCPPEDVGGTWGYEDFLKAFYDPSREEHEHMVAWAGEKFDPEHFDLEAVNEKLGELR